MLISAKWHRACFSVAINVKKKELNLIIEKLLDSFNIYQNIWTNKFRKKNSKLNNFRNFY